MFYKNTNPKTAINNNNIVFRKLELKVNNILIFSPGYTIQSAILLSNVFNKLNFKAFTYNNNLFSLELLDLCKPYNNIYFFFFFPQGLLTRYHGIDLPKNRYYLYQLEQLNQNLFRYQNVNSIEKLIENSIYTFDYSEINLQFYPNYLKYKIKLLAPFIQIIPNYYINKSIDILFIGTITDRRKKILDKLQEKYNIVILEKVFGENLNNYIKISKIVLNLHAFDNSIFELFRIHDILPYNCNIISEKPELQNDLYCRYKSYINFIDIINDDLSNINLLEKEINNTLDLNFYNHNRIDFIKRLNYDNINSLKILLYGKSYIYLFNKYNLNLSDPNLELSYKLMSRFNINKNNKNYVHIHCFNLSEFDEYFKEYIDNLKKYFNIIITYSLNTLNIELDNFVILKIPNKGMDIGGKILMLQYLLDNKLEYKYIVFLHSKNDKKIRKRYFKIIEDIENINKLLKDEKYDAIFPHIKHFEKFDENFYPNHNYLKDFYRFKNLQIKTNHFIEGNVMIFKNNLIDYLFTNNLKLLYNLLNDQYSFDINWVEWYYKIYDTDKELVYNKFKKDKLLGNNKNNKSDKIFTLDPEFFIKMIKSPMINYQFRDGMIEHSFERIYLNLIATLDLNYIMIE